MSEKTETEPTASSSKPPVRSTGLVGREHVYRQCNCFRYGCIFCDGGLSACTVCHGFEGTLTTECCGRPLTEDEEDRIYTKANLDYKDGKWLDAPNYQRPTVEVSHRANNQEGE